MTEQARPGPPRVRLEDDPGGPPRTAETLVASLRDRLAALRGMSGADAIGSLIAGYAAVGREAARGAQAGRIAQALRAGRPGSNGEAVWSALGVDRLAAAAPTPVLDHLRNDIALLLAGDLDAALRAAETTVLPPRTDLPADPTPPDSVDYLVGLWAFAREVVHTVEALAAPTAGPDADAAPDVDGGGPRLGHGPLLR